jgi:hypothetical protein
MFSLELADEPPRGPSAAELEEWAARAWPDRESPPFGPATLRALYLDDQQRHQKAEAERERHRRESRESRGRTF